MILKSASEKFFFQKNMYIIKITDLALIFPRQRSQVYNSLRFTLFFQFSFDAFLRSRLLFSSALKEKYQHDNAPFA